MSEIWKSQSKARFLNKWISNKKKLTPNQQINSILYKSKLDPGIASYSILSDKFCHLAKVREQGAAVGLCKIAPIQPKGIG